jgi:hypothetical protein
MSGGVDKKLVRQPRAAPPDSSPLTLVAAGLDTRLRVETPNSFAGLVFGPDGGIDLYVTVADPVLDRVVHEVRASIGTAVPVRIMAGMNNSLLVLEAVFDHIRGQHAALAARGVQITELGVGILANRVRVGVKGLTSETRALLVARFGAGQVEVYEGQPWITRSDNAEV